MSHAKAFFVSSLAAFALSSSPALAADPVIACGETVTDGVLTGDLDCTASQGFALTVTDGGTLDLAGHTLTGTQYYSLDYHTPLLGGGVQCAGSCNIVGNGGSIVAPAGMPTQTYYSFGVYSDPGDYSVHSIPRSVVNVTDTTISGWGAAAIQGPALNVSGSTFTGNLFGVLGRKKSTVDNCTFTDNTWSAIHSWKMTVTNSTITGNGVGLYALRKMYVYDTTVENNDGFGFTGLKLYAENSSITGNCADTPFQCADLMAIYNRRPRMHNSSCGTSLRATDGTTWGLCTLD